MSKRVKIWLIIAAVLVAVGLVIFTGVMTIYDWDFTKLGTVTYTAKTYEIKEEFDKISINVDITDIEFVPTEDEKCRVVSSESEKVGYSAFVQKDTLVIELKDTRKWYDHISISLGNPKMSVYLPKNEYTSLLIETDTGDINIPEDLSFKSLKIEGDTSDVDCLAHVSKEIKIESDTGNINVDNIGAETIDFSTDTGDINAGSIASNGKINIKTDTGSVNLADVSCADFTAEGDTGCIRLKNVVAKGSLSIENDTGDVIFEDSDASEIYIKTTTGDVNGRLLTDKVFITQTDTGDVDVPKTTTGGRCEITTSTGDIKIDVTPLISK